MSGLVSASGWASASESVSALGSASALKSASALEQASALSSGVPSTSGLTSVWEPLTFPHHHPQSGPQLLVLLANRHTERPLTHSGQELQQSFLLALSAPLGPLTDCAFSYHLPYLYRTALLRAPIIRLLQLQNRFRIRGCLGMRVAPQIAWLHLPYWLLVPIDTTSVKLELYCREIHLLAEPTGAYLPCNHLKVFR